MATQQAEIETIVTVNDYTRNGDFSQALLVLSDLGEPEHPFEIVGGRAAEFIRNRFTYVNVELLRDLQRIGQSHK